MNLEQRTITSMEVSEMVGKEHSKLLRDIRNYCEQLNESKIGLVDFFTESNYFDKKNEERPCYLVTKKGCEFIAHKMTGVKGTEFTARYINKFHEMEEKSKKTMTIQEQIQVIAQGTEELYQKIENVDEDLQNFKREMPLLAIEIEKVTHAVKEKSADLLGGKESNAYRNKSIRGKVFSDIYMELKRQFGLDRSFKELRRNQADDAIEMIQKIYVLPMFLKNEIDMANSQMRLE